MGSLVAELAEKLSSATNNLDFDEQTMFLNTSADTVGIGTNNPASKLDVRGTVQVGVNDTGHDVKFFGATTNNYWLWDESADGVVQRGTLTIGLDDQGHDVRFWGATASRYWLWDESADGVVQRGTLTVGVDDTGHDVKFFGATAGKSWLWDESADKMIITGDTQLTGTLYVGVSDTGHDVVFYGATAGKYWMWDESADKMTVTGIVGLENTLTVGVNDTGHDVLFYGATSGKYMKWDESQDTLALAGSIIENTDTGGFRMHPNANAVGTCTYAFKDDNDTGMIRTGANALAVVTGGTKRLAIDASGNVTKPTQPSFCTRETNGTIDASNQYIRFADGLSDAVEHDTGSDLSVANSNETRFTAPVAGKYLFAWNITMGNTSDNTETRYFATHLFRNGAFAVGTYQSMEEIGDGWGAGNSYDAHPCSAVIELGSGDYVSLNIGKSGQSDYNGDVHGASTHFSGCLLS